jgi:hypothetical protein
MNFGIKETGLNKINPQAFMIADSSSDRTGFASFNEISQKNRAVVAGSGAACRSGGSGRRLVLGYQPATSAANTRHFHG